MLQVGLKISWFGRVEELVERFEAVERMDTRGLIDCLKINNKNSKFQKQILSDLFFFYFVFLFLRVLSSFCSTKALTVL